MLLKILFKLKFLVTKSAREGGANLMNTQVEVPLTVHFESRTAAFDRADEILP